MVNPIIPNMIAKRDADVPADAEEWNGVPNKLEEHFSEKPMKATRKLIHDSVRIDVLEDEVEYYKTLLQSEDTGHILLQLVLYRIELGT